MAESCSKDKVENVVEVQWRRRVTTHHYEGLGFEESAERAVREVIMGFVFDQPETIRCLARRGNQVEPVSVTVETNVTARRTRKKD